MPVMPGKALVCRKVRHCRTVVIVTQRDQVVAGWRYIETSHAVILERRGRIVRRAVDPGTQRRWSDRDAEPVFSRDIKQSARAPIGHQPLAGLAIPLDHLVIVARPSVAELLEHGP